MRTMLRRLMISAALVMLARSAGAQGVRPLKTCRPDSVVSGTVCIDKYEASVWRVPSPATALVRKIQFGRATLADLTAGGATQLGTMSADYAPCTAAGQSCANDIYAVSLPSVIPSARITWFQAQEACANAGKRLVRGGGFFFGPLAGPLAVDDAPPNALGAESFIGFRCAR